MKNVFIYLKGVETKNLPWYQYPDQGGHLQYIQHPLEAEPHNQKAATS